ncbi:MAG TPA: TolC family protein [Bryobacteraceae bacterium]|nr:TolC family protein [Bryobacteraceae bacterium]
MRYRIALSLALAGCAMAGQLPAQEPPLSLADAEKIAIQNHPRVLAAENEAGAAGKLVIEAKSAYLPQLSADITGSQASQEARIGAGTLPASSLWTRFGQGVVFSQLITDSGRTTNLVANSKLQAQASQEDSRATRYSVILDVNRAYYEVLRAQAVLKVAQETAAARQTLYAQVDTLAKNKLRSQLDVSFASVSLSQAKLMVIRAEAAIDGAYAELARALGEQQVVRYKLVDEPLPPKPPDQPGDLVAQALANRPELAGARLSSGAAHKLEQAEKDLRYPTVSIVGVAGFLPLINEESHGRISPAYEGAAVNVDIPIFNGHRFAARREAARYQALAADQRVREWQQQIARDVRTVWSESRTAFERLGVTAQMVKQAGLGLDLAQGRYNLGLSSIVELTQAQLSVTQAQIEDLSARYDYQSQYAALQYAMGLLR